MYKEKIIDIETNKETYRDYTDDEIALVEAAQAESAAIIAAQKAAAEKRAAALAKLEALGLDTDDLKALGL